MVVLFQGKRSHTSIRTSKFRRREFIPLKTMLTCLCVRASYWLRKKKILYPAGTSHWHVKSNPCLISLLLLKMEWGKVRERRAKGDLRIYKREKRWKSKSKRQRKHGQERERRWTLCSLHPPFIAVYTEPVPRYHSVAFISVILTAVTGRRFHLALTRH